MAYSRYRKRKRKTRRRKPSGMKVAHKNMLKGVAGLFALLVFKPSIPISLAQKVQSMISGGAQ